MDDDCTFVAHDSKDFRPMELDFYGDRYYYNLYHWEGVLAEGRHTFKTIAWEKCCSAHGWMLVEMPGGILPGVCAIRPDTLDSESCAYYDETWGWCTGYTLTDDSPYWHQPGAFLPGQVHASMCDTTCGLYSTCTTATCTADEYYECNPDLGNFHETNAMDMRKEREFGNVTAERLASLIYSPSPTTPAPSAAFTPSPLPTPEPTNGDLWTWQSRFTWDHVLTEEPGIEAARLLYQHLAQVQPDTDGGFCDRQISSMWNMQNFYLCYCANYNNLNWREDATRVGCDEGDPAFSSAAKALRRA